MFIKNLMGRMGLLLAAVIAGCASTATETIWVNSLRVHCEGVTPSHCLQIQADSLSEDGWQNFHGTIEGFEFEPGFIYTLEVKRKEVPDPPADAATFTWILVRELSREMDLRAQTNASWSLMQMERSTYTIGEGGRNPVLDIQVADSRFGGNAFCNSMNGQLEIVSEEEVSFGLFAMTKMLCPAQDQEDRYLQLMGLVRRYEVQENELVFFDSTHNELLRYTKSDQ